MSGATGAMAVATGVQMAGQYMQGQQAADAAEYNAQIANQNATIATQQGEAAVQQLGRQQYRQLGAATAAYGASGVTMEGSPTDVLAQSAAEAALDRLTTKYNYQLRALGFQQTAALDEMQAGNARTSGILSAIGTGVKGYGTYSYMTGGGASAGSSGSKMPWAGQDMPASWSRNVA